MERRSLIAAVSTAVSGLAAGCLDSLAASIAPRNLHTVSVAEITQPAADQLQMGLELEEPAITTYQTAKIRLTYTNRGTTPIDLRVEPWSMFPSTGAPPNIYLIPAGGDFERRAPDCWQPTDPLASPLIPQSTTLQSGAEFTGSYEV